MTHGREGEGEGETLLENFKIIIPILVSSVVLVLL